MKKGARMVNFVVVEDNEKIQKNIKDIINKRMFSKEDNYNIDFFYKYGQDLQEVINDTSKTKLYILDIELDNKVSGIQIAEMIRENDWESEIIFITSHDKMFEQVYRSIFKVFDFIEKFHDFEERLDKDINKIVSRKFDNGMFCYQNSKIEIQLYFKDILYIYRDTAERKLVICTPKNRFLVKMSMEAILEILDNRFKMVHRACIVNTNRVTEYNWAKGYFVLDTKEKVELLSKRYKFEKDGK